jgi:hypothetical protein
MHVGQPDRQSALVTMPNLSPSRRSIRTVIEPSESMILRTSSRDSRLFDVFDYLVHFDRGVIGILHGALFIRNLASRRRPGFARILNFKREKYG